MSANSEARKRACEARVAEAERRREVLQQALEAVWSGADFTDADAVLDHLADLGATVTVA